MAALRVLKHRQTPRRTIAALASAVVRCRLPLFGLLALFGDLGRGAGAFGLGLLLRSVALRVGLVLLGLILAVQMITSGDGTGHLFGLALHTFDNALDGLRGPAVLLRHGSTLLSSPIRAGWIPQNCVPANMGCGSSLGSGDLEHIPRRGAYDTLCEFCFQLVESSFLGVRALLGASQVDELVGDKSVAQQQSRSAAAGLDHEHEVLQQPT